ncbi:MAG: hypothetical protein KAF91_24810, partial [Nostoc sp. TH1S01]|nr:hypothetical protein [Nostoc sp. TH1S01]
YNNFSTDYLWMPRVNQTVSGNQGTVFTAKFSYPIIAILPSTTHKNRSLTAGYLSQMASIQLGMAEVGWRYRLPNQVLKVFILPTVVNYQLQFTLAFPVGHCKVQIWEAVPR